MSCRSVTVCSMSDFEFETRLTSIAQGYWKGHVVPDWNIGNNPNGGYLSSIALRAIMELAPQHPDPLTVTTHYLRPGISDEDCTVSAELLRSGRTISTVRATLEQQGKPRIEVLAGLGDLTTVQNDSQSLAIPAPDMPPLDQCVQRSGEEQGVELPLLSRLDIRLHPDEALAGMAGRARVSGWIRFVDGHPPDSSSAVVFADTFPPSSFGLLGMVGWVPTIELTVNVRRRPVPGWVLGQFETRDLEAGRMVEDGLLWDEDGNLIAQSRQLALVVNRE